MEDLVTVFRSADDDAQEDAAEIAELLQSEGIEATLLDDSAEGVPEGVWEVRVGKTNAARAEALVAEIAEDDDAVDDSHELDLVTVYQSGDGSSDGEMEARTVKNLLEASGIYAILAGGEVPIPSLGHGVQVAREHADAARRIISEARAAGPSGADEAEAESESSNPA